MVKERSQSGKMPNSGKGRPAVMGNSAVGDKIAHKGFFYTAADVVYYAA
jgi:hypothetical protein